MSEAQSEFIGSIVELVLMTYAFGVAFGVLVSLVFFGSHLQRRVVAGLREYWDTADTELLELPRKQKVGGSD